MVTPTAISRYLSDVSFPATREELVEFASEHDAPDDIVGALASMPDELYESMAQVWAVVGSLE